jgi:hypothetical protein
MGVQQTLMTAQQETLRDARARYEAGDITFDAFKRAFTDIMQAQDAPQCQAIIQALPASPLTALNALDGLDRAAPRVPRLKPTRWFVTLIGELNRVRRPWRMGQQTHALALIGEVNLDLSLAEIPHDGVLRVMTLIGEVNVYVPPSLTVTVHSFALIGEINALGENHGGIFSFCNEESDAPVARQSDVPHLEIQVFSLIGEVNITRIDQPVMIGKRA